MIGDHYGLPLPAGPAALLSGGAPFLTRAFRAAGVLTENGVARIGEFREISGGSTGRKAMLSIEYDWPAPDLHTDLFVKFSRDLDDPVRDRGKTQMDSEVRFASLARVPEFPIAVPSPQFADYHAPSGTGILITERIKFGANGIETQYHKCLDYEMPEPLQHYRALLTALARLAGTHRSGRLPAELTAHFPVDVRAATVGERTPLSMEKSMEKLGRRLEQLAGFIHTHPGLVPDGVGSPEFLARLADEAPRLARHEDAIIEQLAADADYVALCHWNANIDNAWFWRDDDGALRCGLMDWGCVSQMNFGMALWGAMSGAETAMWDTQLDDLLQLFVAEFGRYGGPRLDPDRLRRHTLLYAAVMGLAWLLDVPALIRKRFDNAPSSRTDPRIRDDESVRAPLQMLSNLLVLWHRNPLGDLLGDALDEEGRVA
ncbi:hypothetical protein [Mycobacterium sp. M23085]|uniref:hypothetical protein n=1 Tax=Mycobacterium sp. M23085 TaxID=3378087 RepID=UPI003877EBD7